MEADDQLEIQEYSPRPLGELHRLWLDVGQMTEEFFTTEVLHTSPSNTFYGVLVLTLISTLTAVLQSLLGSVIHPSGSANPPIQYAFFIALTFTPFSFYLNNALTFFGARLLKGRGKFHPQAYLSSLYAVPLGLVAGLISFIALVPVFGTFLLLVMLLAVGLTYFLLTVRSLKVVHGLPMEKATSAVLLPVMLICLWPFCGIAVGLLANGSLSNPGP